MSFRLYNVQHNAYYSGCETYQKLDARLQFFRCSLSHWDARRQGLCRWGLGNTGDQAVAAKDVGRTQWWMFFFPFSIFVSFCFDFVRWRKRVAKHWHKKVWWDDHGDLPTCGSHGCSVSKVPKNLRPFDFSRHAEKRKKTRYVKLWWLEFPGLIWQQGHLEPLKQQTRVLMQNFAWQIHYLQIWELPKQVRFYQHARLSFFVSTKSSGGFCLETSVFFCCEFQFHPSQIQPKRKKILLQFPRQNCCEVPDGDRIGLVEKPIVGRQCFLKHLKHLNPFFFTSDFLDSEVMIIFLHLKLLAPFFSTWVAVDRYKAPGSTRQMVWETSVRPGFVVANKMGGGFFGS